MSTATLRKTIFVGCRALGLDDEARRDLQLVATGKESMSAMTEADMLKLVDALKSKGFNPSSREPKHRPASRADLRLIHVLWRKLDEAGALKQSGRDGLNAFIRARFEKSWGVVPADVDMLRDWQHIDAVIEALKSWCRRVGADVDWEGLGR